jgi:hypothetical protein
MAAAKKTPKPPKPDFPDDFDPKPTALQGGLARLVRCWEACRDANSGGYKGGVVQSVKRWAKKSTITSCSPFTATVVGMMFDQSGTESADQTYEPKYDGGSVALPVQFYMLHNGFYLTRSSDDKPPTVEIKKKRRERFEAMKWPLTADDATGSVVFFNLGYEIDPRDMRRGDLVKIEWSGGGGHATFCWDVHLAGGDGPVDCFQYLSSNSPGKRGVSVSVENNALSLFVAAKKDGTYEKVKTPKLFEDDVLYLKHGRWICLPGVARANVDLESFKDPTPPRKQLVDQSVGGSHWARQVKVLRFWGVAPPDPSFGDAKYAAKFEQARKLATEKPPKSYATGKGKPEAPQFEKVPTKPIAESEVNRNPKAIKDVPPHADKQKKGEEVAHQRAVEEHLAELHAAGWIDESPGKQTSVIDADTTKATKDFQKKFDAPHSDGIASAPTRRALKKAVADLHAGRHPKKPDKKPKIDRFYWLRNRVLPGGTTMIAVHGKNLDVIDAFQLTIVDKKSGRQAVLPLPIVTIAGSGIFPVVLPDDVPLGTVLTAKLEGKTNDGTSLHSTTEVPLHVEQPIATRAPTGDWPWDEALWTPKMRAIIAELRAEKKPASADFHVRELTQYGVKEKMLPGDTPVLDVDGKELGKVAKSSLMKADIEGTMRLNGRVLNVKKHGNVYDREVEKVINGKTVKVHKPNPEKFEPKNSLWEDVTARAPWGSGACLPLIPFRTLAVNGSKEKGLYRKKVYVEQLDGLALPYGGTHNGVCIVGDCGGMAAGNQFDFFVGREDAHIAIPGTHTKAGVASRVAVLGDCEAAKKKK